MNSYTENVLKYLWLKHLHEINNFIFLTYEFDEFINTYIFIYLTSSIFFIYLTIVNK